MPHMANLPWMEMYLISQMVLLSMNCFKFTFTTMKSNLNNSPKKMKWEW